jgi:YbbR domain-containing protein
MILKKKHGFSIRTMVFALTLSFLLWGYVTMNSEYSMLVDAKVSVKTPPDRAIVSTLPNSLRLKIVGSGWKLLNILSGDKPDLLFDLTNNSLRKNDTDIVLTKIDYARSLRIQSGIQLSDAFPSEMSLHFGEVVSKKVPIATNFHFKMANGFIVTSKIKIYPDSVLIAGAPSTLKDITYWPTEEIVKTNLNGTVQMQVKLLDTMRSVRLSVRTINATAYIERYAETVIHDVPVTVTNIPTSNPHTISPRIVSVTVRGGVSKISQITADNIKVTIPYADIAADSTGSLKPIVTLPNDLQLLSTYPQYLLHTIRSEKN